MRARKFTRRRDRPRAGGGAITMGFGAPAAAKARSVSRCFD
jgi:hypothetical protein